MPPSALNSLRTEGSIFPSHESRLLQIQMLPSLPPETGGDSCYGVLSLTGCLSTMVSAMVTGTMEIKRQNRVGGDTYRQKIQRSVVSFVLLLTWPRAWGHQPPGVSCLLRGEAIRKSHACGFANAASNSRVLGASHSSVMLVAFCFSPQGIWKHKTR